MNQDSGYLQSVFPQQYTQHGFLCNTPFKSSVFIALPLSALSDVVSNKIRQHDLPNDLQLKN